MQFASPCNLFPYKPFESCLQCIKNVLIRSFSGPYFLSFGLNTDQKDSEYGYFPRSVDCSKELPTPRYLNNAQTNSLQLIRTANNIATIWVSFGQHWHRFKFSSKWTLKPSIPVLPLHHFCKNKYKHFLKNKHFLQNKVYLCYPFLVLCK